jgi:hypothetical protein
VGGSVIGGSAASTGEMVCQGSMGPVTIGGSLVGGAGVSSGNIGGSSLASFTLHGSLLGGAGEFSANLFTGGNMGPVTIGGDILGGAGRDSAEISPGGNLARLTVGGSVVGGAGDESATVFGGHGNMGPVLIRGDLRGGTGNQTAELFAPKNLASLVIGGSLIGGATDFSGSVFVLGTLGPVSIAGNLQGGSATGTASLVDAGHLQGGRIVSVHIGGSIIAGTDTTSGDFHGNGAILALNDLGPVTVTGSLIGNSTNPVVISARGQAVVPTGSTADVAIASLTVGGRVEFADILAGYNENLAAVNPDAQVGAVKVGGDWVASNLAAGVDAGSDGLFGTADDILSTGTNNARILASIASVTIQGQALGTVGGSDHFGIVAQKIGALSVGGTLLPLTSGTDVLALGATGDFTALEVV